MVTGHDDWTLRRCFAAVQLGLLVSLLVMLVGRETADLTSSVQTQVPLLVVVVMLALAVEHLSRVRSHDRRSDADDEVRQLRSG